MKLWQKISILCGLVVVLAVGGCTCIQLVQTYNHLFGLATRELSQRQQTLQHGFEDMLNYHHQEGDGAAAERALYHYCFSRLADEKSVLVVDGEVLWPGQSLDPAVAKLALEEKDEGYVAAQAGELVMYGGKVMASTRAGLKPLWVYAYEDLSYLKDAVRQMAGTFALIGLGCTVLGLGLIILAVARAMKPLSALEKAASRIAQGNYSQRAMVRGRDEVGALAQSFNRMAERVEGHVAELTETAQRQRLFIGAVTHEFKTPLTGILLNADSLQNTCLTGEEQDAALSAIQAQGKWLERLVQKLLKLFTLERDVNLTQVSAPELLDRVEASTAEILAARGLTLDVQCSAQTFTGDMDLLHAALVNLVDNAGKASQPGQTLWLTAAQGLLEVADQGSGIPPEAMEHITEPFYMADGSRSKDQGGVGLGLTLVREIAEAHGARLEVESTPGLGTIVRIRFPS